MQHAARAEISYRTRLLLSCQYPVVTTEQVPVCPHGVIVESDGDEVFV